MTKLKMLGVLLAGVILTLGWTTGALTAATALSKTAPIDKNITGIRISGIDRYETAVRISQVGWSEGVSCAVLTSGEENHLVDALLAAPLATVKNAPILLTDGPSLNPRTKEQLKNLKVSKVYITGGEDVITPTVREEILSLGITPISLGGTDRFETAINIAREIGPTKEVFVVNADAGADGLIAATMAALKGEPILLTYSNYVPTAIRSYLSEVKEGVFRSVIVGGSQTIVDEIEEEFPGVVRIGGTDRYDTNVKVLREFGDQFRTATVFISSGVDAHLTDSLSVSTLAGKMRSPILLSRSDIPDSKSSTSINTNINHGANEWLLEFAPSRVVAIGGEEALSETVLMSLPFEGVVFSELFDGMTLNDLSTSIVSPENESESEAWKAKEDSEEPKLPPELNEPIASVDSLFSYTFVDNIKWRKGIYEVRINDVILPEGGYSTSIPGKIILYPEQSPLLQQSGTLDIEIKSLDYSTIKVKQILQAGEARALEVVQQPVPPDRSGEPFAVQPKVRLLDQYGNLCATGVSANESLLASVSIIEGPGDWELDGTTTVQALEGTVQFTDLRITQVSPGTGRMHFILGDLDVTSNEYRVPTPYIIVNPDSTENDVDHDLELVIVDDGRWHGRITGVSVLTEDSVEGINLIQGQDYIVEEGKLVLRPGGVPLEHIEGNPVLQSAGSKEIVVKALNYEDVLITQEIKAGAPYRLAIKTEPVGPGLNKGILAQQPVVEIQDQYGNVCREDAGLEVQAIAAGSPAWDFYNIGVPTAIVENGEVAFSGLQVLGDGGEIMDAQIKFRSEGLLSVVSELFVIPQSIKRNAQGEIINPDESVDSITKINTITGTAYDLDSDDPVYAKIAFIGDQGGTKYYYNGSGWGAATSFHLNVSETSQWSYNLPSTVKNIFTNPNWDYLTILLEVSDIGQTSEYITAKEITFNK